MRYFALATDYDGTLAHDGIVYDRTVKALERLRDSGRKLVLVTGREMHELEMIFPEYGLFHRIVAENGALLFDPETRNETLLAHAPPAEFAAALRRNGVAPVIEGRVIVATWADQQERVLQTVHELGLELQLIFNKESLMVLPTGINKATGLAPALDQLGVSLHNTVGVGDAENDHAFLDACARSVAVANALPALKHRASLVTRGARGEGVAELIDLMLEDDLRGLPPPAGRDSILLGTVPDGGEVRVPAFGASVLLAGVSGGGKSTLMTGVMERLTDACYQFCALDPEGDYQTFDGALILGDAKHDPSVQEVLGALDKPRQNVIVNLLGVALHNRPAYFENLLLRLDELRARAGRPHWMVLDEAHHMVPASRPMDWPADVPSMLLAAMKPTSVPQEVLAKVETLIAVGEETEETIREFCSACGLECPQIPAAQLEKGQAILWSRHEGTPPAVFNVAPCRTPRVRHSRKYAAADLTPDRSFYFRGPEGKLNLRAQNLITFVQLLDGVDDETWLYHLRRAEYSKWFRDNIKNEELAQKAEQIERDAELSAAESKGKIKREIEERYTLGA